MSAKLYLAEDNFLTNNKLLNSSPGIFQTSHKRQRKYHFSFNRVMFYLKVNGALGIPMDRCRNLSYIEPDVQPTEVAGHFPPV